MNRSVRYSIASMGFALVIQFFLALVLSLCLSPSTQAAETKIPGWTLKQWSLVDGDVQISLCVSAIKILIPKSGLVLVSSAPWHIVTVYSHTSKRIWTATLSNFQGPNKKAQSITNGSAFLTVHVIAKGEVEILGLQCLKYVQPAGFREHQLAAYRRQEVAPRAAQSIEYLTTKHFAVPEAVGEIIARFYGTPIVEGVPVQFIYHDVNGDSRVQFSLSQASRAVFQRSDFNLPQGLLAVHDIQNVYSDGDSTRGVVELMFGAEKKDAGK